MSLQKSQYKPLPQSEQDALILKILAVLSAIFCLAMFSIALYILIHKIAPFEAIILLFYIATLFAGFSYAALSIHQYAENRSPIIKRLSQNSVCYGDSRNLSFIQPDMLAQTRSNTHLFHLERKICSRDTIY
jgi:hypothetical protein